MEVGELTALTPVVAQMVERRSHIPGVGGSSPPHGTIYNKELFNNEYYEYKQKIWLCLS